MMGDYLMPIYTTIVSLVCGYLFARLKKLLDENKKLKEQNKLERTERERALNEGVKYLLKVKLIEYHDKYMAVGLVPSYAFQNFEEMYIAYHNLGGNGMITKMYNEMKELTLSGNDDKQIN